MRLLVVSDAWYPQVNGVVRTLDTVTGLLRGQGHTVETIGPDRFRSIPCPTYPEIRLAVDARGRLPAMVDAFAPDAVHIATEGPLGLAMRRYCLRRGLRFTTSFHTRFPEYLHARIRLPVCFAYAWLRRFHGAAAATMVATPSLQTDLEARGFTRLVRWSRGVDTAQFRPCAAAGPVAPGPNWLYVGRVAVEKNIQAFLDLSLPGIKHVVGDGPMLETLRRRYPEVRFAGALHGADLARHYAEADVFVFPSRTDTFGLVLLEALASGLPVAAYPVTGPLDVIGDSGVGALDEDLGRAARRALDIPRDRCRDFALRHDWTRSAGQFLDNLVPVR